MMEASQALAFGGHAGKSKPRRLDLPLLRTEIAHRPLIPAIPTLLRSIPTRRATRWKSRRVQRMEDACDQTSGGFQQTRNLPHHDSQVRNVMQHRSRENQIELRVTKRERLADIRHDKI